MNSTRLFVTLFTIILTACNGSNSSPSSNLTSSTASMFSSVNSSNSYTTENNLLYGFHERHTLDISYARDVTTPAPAVLFIHGGSWISGDKSSMLKYRASIISEGYVYISMNYRLISSQATYLDMLEDVELAITYIKTQTSDMPIDTTQIVLAGESAGAHLAMLYSYRNTSPITIKLLLALVPPVDFTDPDYINFGNPTNQLFLANQLMQTNIIDPNDLLLNGYPTSWYDASPIHFLETAIPTLIGYGAFDELIPQSNYSRFLDKANEINAPVEAILFPNSGHALDNDPIKLEELFAMFFANLKTNLSLIISFDI
jgi:acetyl esterase/lipase